MGGKMLAKNPQYSSINTTFEENQTNPKTRRLGSVQSMQMKLPQRKTHPCLRRTYCNLTSINNKIDIIRLRK